MFKGSGVALVTPFKSNQIDVAALRKLVDFQIDNGTDFLVPMGTTGECSTLSHDEHVATIKIVVDQAAGRVPVLAGAGSNSTEEAIALTLKAADAGASGSLQICPYYNKPTQNGVYQHFAAIAKACSLPIILYNIKGRTGINIEISTMKDLSQISNIIGIKEANGSIDIVSQILEQVPNFLVLSGEDAITYPMLALGAHGAISVTANILPQLCAQQWDAILKRDFVTAAAIHFRLAEINRALFIETNPIPVKTALSLMQFFSLEFRLPLCEMTAKNLEVLKSSLRNYQLIK